MKNEFKPIDAFIGDTNKSKLTDTQAYLNVKNPLLLCVRFSLDTEVYLLEKKSKLKKPSKTPKSCRNTASRS